jgi:hypothetical protein
MTIQYSNAPGKLVKEVDEFSGYKLKKRADLQIIFEETLNKGKEKLLEDLAFTSKYVQGLIRVLRESSNNPEIKNLENIQSDLGANMQKAITRIKEIVASSDGSTQQYFQRTYFELSQQGFMNLNDLLSDMEWTKKYINDLKRRPKN